MLNALKWTTRSLRTHSWPRTQEERQLLEAIMDRKVSVSFPVPLSKAFERIRAKARCDLEAAHNGSADTTVRPPAQLQSDHDGKAVCSPTAPQADSARPKKWLATLDQLKVLETIFQQSPNPSTSLHHELSVRLGVPLKSISNWYSNRRRKAKAGIVPKYTRCSQTSVSDVVDFGDRPKDPLLSTTILPTHVTDRPPVRTLDLSQVTPLDFHDLSNCRSPHITVIIGSETQSLCPIYDIAHSSRVAFPPNTTGVFYLHAPAHRPAYERSIRFRLVPNADSFEDLHNRKDLLGTNGLPWSLPLWTADSSQWAFVAKAVGDGFMTEDMKRFKSIVNKPPFVGRYRKGSVLVCSMPQVFAVPLDREKMTIWLVTDETKTRLRVKTDFLGEFRRRDGSEAGYAHVLMMNHPVHQNLVFVVQSVQRSKGGPQVKVPTPTYTLLKDVLINTTQYECPIDK